MKENLNLFKHFISVTFLMLEINNSVFFYVCEHNEYLLCFKQSNNCFAFIANFGGFVQYSGAFPVQDADFWRVDSVSVELFLLMI